MFMANEALSDGKQSPQYWINLGLALLTIASAGYLVLFENALYARETEYVLSDYIFSIIAIALAIEFTRRTTGWFMPILITLSLSYILFLGRYIGGVFAFPGLSLETVMYRSYFTSEGMFGLTANISSTFVFMFIIFGAFLLKSGAGDFIDRFCGGQYRLDRCDHYSDDEKIRIHSAVCCWSRSRGIHRRRAYAARHGRGCFRTRQLYTNLLSHGNCRFYAASPALLSDRVLFCPHRGQTTRSDSCR